MRWWPGGVPLVLAFACASGVGRLASAQVAAPTPPQPDASIEPAKSDQEATRSDASSETPAAGSSGAAGPGIAPPTPAGAPAGPGVAPTGPAVVPTGPTASRPKSPGDAEWDVPAPGDARAPSLAPADQPPVETRTRWYGWQTVPMDVLAITFVSLSFCEETSTGGGDCSSSSTYQALGLLAYGVGAPAIHVLNRNGGSAVASVGLRLGMPLVGGLLAGGLGSSEDSAGTGIALFAVGAMLIDATFLARVEEPVENEPASATLVPTFVAQPGRVGAGFAGSF